MLWMVAPATGGRIMRACTMPGRFTSVHERFRAERLRRDVGPPDRLADDLVFLGVLRRRLARRVERVADLLVPFKLDVEVAPADQLGVGGALRGIALGVDDAVGDGQLIGRQIELLRRHLDQHPARFGRSRAHLLAAVLDAGGARRAALVHAGAGVGHEDLDALERHVELFGDDLADGDIEALAHVHLAEEGAIPSRRR